MKFEVFHRGLLGRPDIIAVDMVHYPGLWGMCFSHHPPHNNHPRFAETTAVRFIPHACYGGLHYLGSKVPGQFNQVSISWRIAGGKSPVPFAVSDDFYWNRAIPQTLTLHVTYEDCAPGSLWVEYDAWSDPFQPTPPVTLAGDGKLKTALFSLENARLGNSQDSGADLRLMRTPGTPLSIRGLELVKPTQSDRKGL